MHTAKALSEVGSVDVAVVGGEGKNDEWAQQPNRTLEVVFHAPIQAKPNVGLISKCRWIVSPGVPYPHGCGISEDETRSFLALAKSYDVVWFCKLRTANMFPRWSWPRSVVDIDDVPSGYEHSVWQRETSPIGRAKAWLRFASWRRRDMRLDERFPVLTVCSETDKTYLRTLGIRAPIHIVPNGYECPENTPVRTPSAEPRVGFIGIFDYEPNRDGVRWFVNRCWPLVKRDVPTARLRLIGRYSDGPLAPEGPDVDRLGWMESTEAEIATWSVFIVPIRIGAGTRGKIAHAFSAKCPVVSTTLGAYGYEVEHEKEMLLADTPEEFARACVRLINDPALGERLAANAWQSFLRRWTWDVIKPSVRAAVEECLRLGKESAVELTDRRLHERTVSQ